MCDYSIVKAEVKAMYNHQCQLCYEQFPNRKLQIHHILPKKFGGKNTHFNLLPLCGGSGTNDCHLLVHTNGITHNSKNQRVMYSLAEICQEA